MHHFKVGFVLCQIFATLTAANPIPDTPTTTLSSSPDLSKRAGAGPSSYPYGTAWTNEMSWENWDPTNTGADRAQGQQLHDAYVHVKAMAVYAWQEADKKSLTFKRWFAEADADNVKKVLERIMDMGALIPEAVPRMKDRILDRADYRGKCIKQPSLNAYTAPKTGRHHFCPFGLGKPNLSTLKCDDLDKIGTDNYSSKKIRTVAGTMFHEALHWVEVGDAALGKHITDVKPGGKTASGCHELSDADKLINAQNYAFFASEAYLQLKGCHFADPPANTNEVDDNDVDDEVEEGDTKAISIIYRSFVVGTYSENDWYVYETPVGVSALCRPADETVAKWSAADGPGPSSPGPDWPAGTFDINVDNMECQYKNDGKSAGALWCKGRNDPISCYKDSKLDKREGKYCDGGRIYQQPYVYCQW